jgi:riboflavin synthase
MYTGIVQRSVEVTHLHDEPGLRTFAVRLPQELRDGLEIGASVGLDGVCLTVTRIDSEDVFFDAIRETQELTTLGEVELGNEVNVERSALSGAEIGGHEISGHVDGTLTIRDIENDENNCVLTFAAPANRMKYIFPKGFIALNGCSLTVVDVDREKAVFTVHLIPETLGVTTFGAKHVGDRVNFEIDRKTQVIVDTVRSFLSEQARDGSLAALVG